MSLTLPDTDNMVELAATVDDAVSFIIEALEDPLNPRWCASSIIASMVVIRLDHQTTETLINANHLFGSTIAAFLTAKRSTEDIITLASRWSKCNCSDADITQHGDAARNIHVVVAGMAPVIAKYSSDPKYGEVDHFRRVVENFAQFFEDAVTKVKPFSVAQGRHPEIWPATPKDLIPYGPEITVESLVTMSRYMGTGHVFYLLSLFARICGPVIIPAIVASRSTPKYMIEYGTQLCSDVSNVPLSPSGKADRVHIVKFMHELGHLGAFVNTLLSIPPLLGRDFHFGFAEDAFRFAALAITTMESPAVQQVYGPELKPALDTLSQYAAVLYTTLPEQMTVRKACIHPVIRTAMDRLATPSPPAEFACSMMRHARSIQFCFAPGCMESAQSSGRSYMRCSGCRIVAYSSKECQARAWTDNHTPHRDICKKMKQVYDLGGDYLHREEDQARFVREMKRARIKDVMLKEIALWLCAVYSKLQRTGPFLTPDVRQYLLQKEGPRFAEGVEEHMQKVKSSLLSNPRARSKAKK